MEPEAVSGNGVGSGGGVEQRHTLDVTLSRSACNTPLVVTAAQ